MSAVRLISVFLILIFNACSETPQEKAAASKDRFSYANTDEVVVSHIDIDLKADFGARVLDGYVFLYFDRLQAGADKLVLDTRDLEIRSVSAGTGTVFEFVDYSLGERDPLLGQSLTIPLPEGAEWVQIQYRTSPEASGLQWLSPEQTQSGEHPFLFSQSQAIHARSWLPLQDTPSVRFTYTAHLTTPPELLALMSAAQDPDGMIDGDYTFEMPQPVPAYLMAIAVGDLEFRDISYDVGVYAESYIVDAAAEEFSLTPAMVAANENLYGPYRWGRFDLLVLPPSFPFGGMENPRLSFLTPTLIAGDKSLTNIVAHELAHSWAGNLVTNSSWRDSWINEGITSYVENRVMEELYGKPRAAMEQVLALADWKRDLEAAEDPALTALALPASLESPDDAFSNIAYVKGQFFLHFLEDRFGREIFDTFLKGYFDNFAFQSISTADFESYLYQNLIRPNPGNVTEAEIREWLYGPGMPETRRQPVSNAFEKVDTLREAFLSGETDPRELPAEDWTTHEWLHFINGLPGDTGLEALSALDRAFDLSHSENAEIAFAWYMKALKGGYEEVKAPLEAFLLRVGRGRFIYRLYERLIETGNRDWALAVYERARRGYHPIARDRIEAIFAETGS